MISFVYFDLGGVVEIDFTTQAKWISLRKELGISEDYKDQFSQLFKELDHELCTTLDCESLIPIFKEKFHAKIPDTYSLLDGFIKRFDRNKSIWPIIAKVQQSCKIGLLTNMYPGMLSAIEKSDILPDIKWDTAIDSSVVGFAKPDKEIFQIAQEKAGVDASEILFTDNNKANIEAAKTLGWQVYFYDSSDPEKSSRELLSFWQKLQ